MNSHDQRPLKQIIFTERIPARSLTYTKHGSNSNQGSDYIIIFLPWFSCFQRLQLQI